MTKNGHTTLQVRVPVATGPSNSNIVEFSLPLHVVKKCDEDSEHDSYSLHIWNGVVLRTLCMAEPLDKALNVIAQMLRESR